MMSSRCRAYQGTCISCPRPTFAFRSPHRSETRRCPLGIGDSAVGDKVGADRVGWGQGLTQPCLSCLCDLEMIVSQYGVETEVLHWPWLLTGH